MPTFDRDHEDLTIPESKRKIKKPPLYKVLLHNDNYTTMDFVVYVLTEVFHKSESEAVRIMLQVHQQGVGIAGVFTFEIAEMKTARVTALARQHEYPLLCTLQEE